MVKIDFEFTTAYGMFRDALYLPDDHTLTEYEISQLKQQRLDGWIYAIENPTPLSEEDRLLAELFVPPTDEAEQ